MAGSVAVFNVRYNPQDETGGIYLLDQSAGSWVPILVMWWPDFVRLFNMLSSRVYAMDAIAHLHFALKDHMDGTTAWDMLVKTVQEEHGLIPIPPHFSPIGGN